MRKYIYSSLILLLFIGCGTRQSVFEINGNTDIEIKLGLSLVEAHFIVKDQVRIPFNTTMNNLGFKPDEIAEVNPLTCIFRPKFGDEIDLDFINALNVYIIDPVEFKQKEIFYLDFIQGGEKTEIELLPTLIDITDYLINDRAIIEVRLDLRQFPPQTFDLSLDMGFAAYPSE